MMRAKMPSKADTPQCNSFPRLFNQATAASYFSISERSFEKWWRSGKLPAPCRLGRRLLWDRKRLDGWADELSGLSAYKNDFGD